MAQASVPSKDEPLFSNRDLLRLIVPLVVEQFLAIFIGLADTVMVSTISESAVSAISLVDSINVLFIQLFAAMATGGAVVAAQYLGRREPLNACGAAKQLFYATLALSVVIGALCIAFCEPILRLCFGGLNESTMAYCRTYFYLSALSYPAIALYNVGAALLRAMGNSKASMFTSLMMNVLNVTGNAILIYGCGMEVAGAAVASLLSRVLGAAVMVWMLLHPTSPIHLIRPRHPDPDLPMIKRIFRQAVPNGLENSMFQIGKLMVAGTVALFSEAVIAANAVSNSVASMANLPGVAIGLAMVTVVGQCAGAGQAAQARRYAKKLILIAYACMAVLNVILFFIAPQVAGIFKLSPEGVDAASEVLRWFAVAAIFFWPASFTTPSALRAAGDSRFTMGVSVFCMWTFRIGASYLFVYVFHMRLLGVWLAMIIDWVVRAGLFTWRFHGSAWLQKKVV